MNLQSKTTLLTVILMGILVFFVLLVSLFFFRQFSLATARDHVRSVAEIVRVSLTESMINGTIGHRQQFLQRLAEVQGFESARVVRGAGVNRQFLADLADEVLADEIENRVFASGFPYFGILKESISPLFRGTIPFVAHDRGKPDCLQCHQVTAGTVLGVITVHLSMDHLRRKALTTVGFIVFIVIAFSVILTLLFRWQLSLVVQTAQGVEAVVARARGGDFGGRLAYQGKDEMGRISRDLNSLMSHLQGDLGAISQDVSRLIQYDLRGHTNLLTTTTEMVDILLDVAQFKQTVEEERFILHVYQRIGKVLTEQFWVKYLSIYEVMRDEHQLKQVLFKGVVEGGRLCRLEGSDCVARKGAEVVDSSKNLVVCPYFVSPTETEEMAHFCLPVIHSGAVGNVIQIVVKKSNACLYQMLLPFIQVYLRESASTVEAKRLLDASRESALRDPMTGLHNRRFLEEYVATLESTTRRHQARLAVLLLDLDHFKSVNDTWGHDAGDRVLKALAKVLEAQVVRTSDLVIRFGGEEFLVILKENESAFGASMAERIRSAVENLQIPIDDDTTLCRTLSIGVAKFPDDGDEIWAVIKHADQALYQAKAEGRNRVVVFRA